MAGILLSDIVGNDHSAIESGPLTPDERIFADARQVLSDYDVAVPDAVDCRLADGESGGIPKTPSAGNRCLESVSTTGVASNETALNAAAKTARKVNFRPLVLGSRFQGSRRRSLPP